MPEIGGTLGQF
jgi:hypothetical protein